MSLCIGFAGTPAFAAVALAAVAESGTSIALVLTRPDKPKGRGQKVEPSAVKREAQRRGVPVIQPPTLRSGTEREHALTHRIDVLVVAAYGLILPPDVLRWPRYGCLNIHASLLPRWRGAAPIQRALMAGDRASGVTIMQMDEGLDTGGIVAQRHVAIDPRETAGSLHDRLADEGAAAIVEVLGELAQGRSLPATPQPVDGVSYAAKITRDEARIDWTADAQALDRRVRALDPAPGAYTTIDQERVKIWSAWPVDAICEAAPGTVLAAGEAGVDVACGRGALRLTEVQGAGGTRLPVGAFLAGHRWRVGMRFGAEPGSVQGHDT